MASDKARFEFWFKGRAADVMRLKIVMNELGSVGRWSLDRWRKEIDAAMKLKHRKAKEPNATN